MCGIAGILGLGDPLGPADLEALHGMTAVLHHRGPDDRRHVDFPRCALGNTRLEVLDLSERGALPMPNADGTVWMAYNGEVTNFLELKERFGLADRYPFRSTTDTEVLIHLYEALGIDFCRHLTGQFAFALYDSRKEKAWLVRDPYGIRPLFFMRAGRRLYFGSEIKAFLDLPGFDRTRIDLEGLYHSFTLGYIPLPHTPFEQVEELRGGRVMEINLASGSIHESRYYEPRYAAEPVGDERELGERVYAEMRESVRRNLVSDAPLGLTLSGGFDTSSILALAREIVGDRELRTYSLSIQEPSFDESPHQHVMAEFARTIHHEIRVGPREVMGALERQMAFMDEPTADGAAIPSFLLAERARRDVKVLLSGEGGDETFTAYETYRAWKLRRGYRMLPAPLRALIRRGVHAWPADYRKLSFDFLAKRFTDGAELGPAEAHVYWRHTLTDADKAALLPSHRIRRTTGELAAALYDGYPYPHELDRLSALDLETYFIGDLMVKNDRTIMAHSIETRFPYMDRLLFDFVSTIPADQRLKGLKGRYMQKLAMRGRVPASISGRKNMGLELPHSLWLLGEMRPLVDRYLSRSAIDRTGFLSPAVVDRLWQEHRERKRDNGRALWSIITTVVWFELFVASSRYKQHLPAPAARTGAGPRPDIRLPDHGVPAVLARSGLGTKPL